MKYEFRPVPFRFVLSCLVFWRYLHLFSPCARQAERESAAEQIGSLSAKHSAAQTTLRRQETQLTRQEAESKTAQEEALRAAAALAAEKEGVAEELAASRLEHAATQQALRELREAHDALAAEAERLGYLLKPHAAMSIEQVPSLSLHPPPYIYSGCP